MAIAATYVSSTVFTVALDQTSLFTTDRLVRLTCGVDGYRYGTIVSSAYTTLTTVTIAESVITSNLEAVVVGLVQSGTVGSLPVHNHSVTYGQGGYLDGYVPDGGPFYGNLKRVAESGAEYSSIQSAIDSITDASSDNRYVIQVFPGKYTENIVGKDYVSLTGLPSRIYNTQIYSTSGTLLTMPANEAHISWIDLVMNPTSDSDILIDATAGGGSTGRFRIENCQMDMISTAAIKPVLLKANANFGLFLLDDIITYNMTNSGNTGTLTPFVFQSGNDRVYLMRTAINCITGATNCDIEGITDNSTGRIWMEISNINIICTNPSYAGTAKGIAIYGGYGGVTNAKQYNNILISMTSVGNGTSYEFYTDSDTNDQILNISRCTFDSIGFSNIYRYYIGTGDTVLSYFNRHRVPMTDVNNGTLKAADIYDNNDFIITENIGAGTLAPEAQLHIKGGAAGVILEHDSGVQWGLRSLSGGYFKIRDREANKDRLIFDDDGNMNVGESNPDASAILSAESTTKGFAPPRMTGTQVESISSPTEGLMVYATSAGSGDVTGKGMYYWDGTNWIAM